MVVSVMMIIMKIILRAIPFRWNLFCEKCQKKFLVRNGKKNFKKILMSKKFENLLFKKRTWEYNLEIKLKIFSYVY